MKTINVSFEDAEHQKIVEYKQKHNLSWRGLILNCVLDQMDVQ